MIYCEALMLTILFFTLFLTVRSDFKSGVIENKKVFFSSILCAVMNAAYYSFFAQEFFLVFLINFLTMSVVSVLLYGYNIWAAGDSKLMMNVLLAIPGRFYFFNYKGVLPGFVLLIAIFSTAFLFIICESIYLCLVGNKWNTSRRIKLTIDWKSYLKSMLACITTVYSINGVLTFLFPEFFVENSALLLMVTFLLVLTILNFSGLRRTYFIVITGTTCVTLTALGVIPIYIGFFDYRPYVLLLVVLALKTIANRYNYRVIPVGMVKQGMILSIGTIVRLSSSSIKGLPSATTEDLRSRLTKEEADSVAIWGVSVKGEATISIVRKIPFAIFIAIGTVLFIILELV